jgi:hypothetical protein
VEVPIDLQESFLVDVASVFGALHKVEGQAEDVAVIAANEFFEGGSVARLGALDQDALIEAG